MFPYGKEPFLHKGAETLGQFFSEAKIAGLECNCTTPIDKKTRDLIHDGGLRKHWSLLRLVSVDKEVHETVYFQRRLLKQILCWGQRKLRK